METLDPATRGDIGGLLGGLDDGVRRPRAGLRPHPAPQRAGARTTPPTCSRRSTATARRCGRSSATASAWSSSLAARPRDLGGAADRAGRRCSSATAARQAELRETVRELGPALAAGPPDARRARRRHAGAAPAGRGRRPGDRRAGPVRAAAAGGHRRGRPAARRRPAGSSSDGPAPSCASSRPIARAALPVATQARAGRRARRCRSPGCSRSTCPRPSARSRTSAPPRAPTTPTATCSTWPRSWRPTLPDSALTGGELGPADCDPQRAVAGQAGAAAEAVHPRAGRQRVPALDRPAARHPHARAREALSDRRRRPGDVRGHGAAARARRSAFLYLSSRPAPRTTAGRRPVRGRLPADRGDERPRRRRDRRLGRARSRSTTRASPRSRCSSTTTIEPPRADATAAIRQQDTTGDSYVAFEPGRSRRAAARGRRPAHDRVRRGGGRGALPAHARRAALRRPAQRLRAGGAGGHPAHAHELARAVDGRGTDLNRAALDLRPGLAAANRALAEVNRQNAALRSLIADAEAVTRPGRVRSAQPRAARSTRSPARCDVTAAETRSLDAGLERLPATVRARRARRWPRCAAPPTAARPLAEELRDGAPQLATAVAARPRASSATCESFLTRTRPTLELTHRLCAPPAPTIEAEPARVVTGPFDLAPAISNLLRGVLGEDETIEVLFNEKFGLGAVSAGARQPARLSGRARRPPLHAGLGRPQLRGLRRARSSRAACSTCSTQARARDGAAARRAPAGAATPRGAGRPPVTRRLARRRRPRRRSPRRQRARRPARPRPVRRPDAGDRRSPPLPRRAPAPPAPPSETVTQPPRLPARMTSTRRHDSEHRRARMVRDAPTPLARRPMLLGVLVLAVGAFLLVVGFLATTGPPFQEKYRMQVTRAGRTRRPARRPGGAGRRAARRADQRRRARPPTRGGATVTANITKPGFRPLPARHDGLRPGALDRLRDLPRAAPGQRARPSWRTATACAPSAASGVDLLEVVQLFDRKARRDLRGTAVNAGFGRRRPRRASSTRRSPTRPPLARDLAAQLGAATRDDGALGRVVAGAARRRRAARRGTRPDDVAGADRLGRRDARARSRAAARTLRRTHPAGCPPFEDRFLAVAPEAEPLLDDLGRARRRPAADRAAPERDAAGAQRRARHGACAADRRRPDRRRRRPGPARWRGPSSSSCSR